MRRILALLALAGLLPGGAGASEQHTLTSVAYVYVLPDLTIGAGDSVQLRNLDRDVHTVTSVDTDPLGRPLFDTPFTGAGFLETAPVHGVERLGAGDYDYFCARHPDIPTMRGVIRVR